MTTLANLMSAPYAKLKTLPTRIPTPVTGGKGSITQWVHAEYMEGSETIHLTFTQWVRGGYFSKVPTKVPTGFFENFIQKVPIMCLSHSVRVLSKITH